MQDEQPSTPTEEAVNPSVPGTSSLRRARIGITVSLMIILSVFGYRTYQSVQVTTGHLVEIAQLKQNVIQLQEVIKEDRLSALHEEEEVASEIDFPVIVYARSGLLNTTPEGLVEKARLEKMFIEPYVDYKNEDGLHLVALHITVPADVGEEYGVLGIFGSETLHGTEAFSFGEREGEYGYWKPNCLGECEYSSAFTEKYPEIVNAK